MTGDSQQAVRTGVERVLAHLQSTNHLVPAGGMALTAEQVEDVRLIASENYPLDSDPTASINRLRALFPATEPPEEAVGDPLQAWKEFLKPKPIGWYRTMTPQFATEHFGFPSVIGSKGFWTHTASDGGKWAWDGDDWELSEYSPAPAEPAGPCSRGVCSANNGHEGTCAEASGWAEPAEEETKAEELSNVELSCLKMICDLCKKSYKGTVWLPINDMVQGFIDRHYLTRDENDSCKPTINAEKALASLPVVPAPTETGPWDSIEEVPEGVTVRGTNPVAGLWRGGPYWKSVSPEHSAAVSSLAPFVAAEEG
ncbi:hypothetical protein ACSVIA_20405 [Rhodococcus erythropolis]|uniref:hypothetical protein n=1 Tax=Rhodococcus erythropolis TaxID=1833 RepID=UPI0040433FBD